MPPIDSYLLSALTPACLGRATTSLVPLFSATTSWRLYNDIADTSRRAAQLMFSLFSDYYVLALNTMPLRRLMHNALMMARSRRLADTIPASQSKYKQSAYLMMTT